MSDFKGRHFEGEIVLWAVRWYCRYGVSYRDLEQMMGDRGVSVDHSTIYRWVQRYAPAPVSGPSPLHALSSATRGADRAAFRPEAHGIESDDYVFQPGPRDYGRQFLTAGTQNEVAPSDSVFTRLLIDILDGQRAQEASLNFDYWTTGTELGYWLAANTRRLYRGKENPTTPVFGSLSDDFYQNGGILFARLDIPASKSRVLPEELWPSSVPATVVAQAPTATERETAERRAQELAMAATDSATVAISKEAAADQMSDRLGVSVGDIEGGGIFGGNNYFIRDKGQIFSIPHPRPEASPRLKEAEAQAELARAEADAARSRAEQQAAEAGRAAGMVAALDATAARVDPTAPPVAEGRLSGTQEAELQGLVNHLSSEDVQERRAAREAVAAFLRGLTPAQQATTTERLLGNLSRKSYRYQLGVAVVLAKDPVVLNSAAQDIVLQEVQNAISSNRDRTLDKCLRHVQVNLKPNPSAEAQIFQRRPSP